MTVPLRVDRYELVPLKAIRRDDVRSFLGPDPGVYVCNAPTPGWLARYKVVHQQAPTIEKKRAMFESMAPGSRWISPTFAEESREDTEDWQEGAICHLGYGRARGRVAQTIQTVKIARLLHHCRHAFSYVLLYNLPLPTSLGAFTGLLGSSTRVLLDYEDDYTLQRQSAWKNWAEKLLRQRVDGAICANAAMVATFQDRPTCVVNAFIDTVPPTVLLRDHIKLLYAGSLDSLRGVDLVPALVNELRKVLRDFTLCITGDGPLRTVVESWTFPEVRYLGLLPDREYERQIISADACLVLQRPDHPFSRGSFPSKIQAYARRGKPVFVLRAHGHTAPWEARE